MEHKNNKEANRQRVFELMKDTVRVNEFDEDILELSIQTINGIVVMVNNPEQIGLNVNLPTELAFKILKLIREETEL